MARGRERAEGPQKAPGFVSALHSGQGNGPVGPERDKHQQGGLGRGTGDREGQVG